MSVDLSSYRAVEIGNLVRIVPPVGSALLFTDMNRSVTVDGVAYSTLGGLLSVSDFYSELRAIEQEVTVGIAGIPTTNVTTFLNTDYKGSEIEIRRAYFNPVTQAALAAGSSLLKFRGLINSFNMQEDWDGQARTATFTITLVCNSLISTIIQRVSGRRTNDGDQTTLYPGDLSMSRVATITNASFQFGKPDAGTNR